MSKLSRYNLLISLVRSELKCEHVLTSSDDLKHNQMLYRKHVEAWIFLTEDLMCENAISEQARNTRISNLIKTLNQHDASLTFNLLKSIYNHLIDHISGKRSIIDYVDFKGLFNESENLILGYIISPIKESLLKVLKSQLVLQRDCYVSESKKDMWRCSHYLLFLSKVNFTGVGLEAKALEDYLSFESETASLDVDLTKTYIRPLQKIIYDWMKDWTYDGLTSSHGPGSVADCTRDKCTKYLNLKSDKLVSYLYQNDKDAIDSNLPFGSQSRQLERTSKLVFVPKNITKLRSISMEPATLQYLQQGCMKSLYTYFRKQKDLQHILKLEDQSQNKSFAYHGSITNDYATIDLSHASDSVNWKLTKKLFARVPHLLRWLVCTRSTHTLLPDGTKIELSKFAPMGSALCFPIESLIFAAIAKLAILLSKEQALDRNSVTGIRSSYNYLSVYGDDIIVPKYAANKCIDLLKLFGFTPNEDKSYLDGPFKESCGGNYYCGYDITALKFAPSFDTSFRNDISPEAYTALCGYANLAYQRGLYLFRLYCIKQIFEAGLKPLFTDQFGAEPAIYSPHPTNFHLKKIYVKRYQKYEYLYTGTKTLEKDASQYVASTITRNGKKLTMYHTDNIFLYDYLRSKYIQKGENATSLYNMNARRIGSQIVFDDREPYSRASLLPQVFKFTLCRREDTISL